MEGEKARTSNQNEHPTPIPKSISIFTLNTFLIPSWIAFWSKDNASCAKQDDRAEQIGKFAKDKDLVVLQEVWGSQVDKIESQLRPSHTFLLGYESWSLFGYGSTLFTSAKFQYHQNGGLWFACKKELCIIQQFKRTFSVSGTKSAKGICVSVLQMNKYWGDNTYLLIVNTHLDTGRFYANQKRQLQEIRTSIQKVCNQVAIFHENFDVSKCGILLVGDFNFTASSPLYLFISELFDQNIRDLYKEFAQTTGKAEEPTFDANNSYNIHGFTERIDYIFAIDGWKTTKAMALTCEQIEICKQTKGEEFSDHWGHTARIRPKH